MDCRIHSLSLSHTSLFEQKDNHIIRLDYFQTDDFLASKQFLLILWISDCRRPLFSLSPPPWLLQAAILPKITLLIVVRSKAIPKFKKEKSGREVGIQSKKCNQIVYFGWHACAVHYKWWLSSVITHHPDVPQNSNYLSIRHHIFTRNHRVLSQNISIVL